VISTPAKLGIIAGAGTMPLQIAHVCEKAKRPYFVVAVDEFADPVPATTPHTRIRISKIGASIAALKRNGCKDVVFAGKLERPNGGSVKLRPDWGGLMFLIRYFGVLRGHNDGIHRAITHMFAGHGLHVVSPLAVAPELAAQAGSLTRTTPSDALRASFQAALSLAKEHGATNAGQAVVVHRGAIIAREGRAGTDAMLASLGRLSEPGAILVKAMAPTQLPTMDPPAIGEGTLGLAAAAGLSGILIEAGRSVVVDAERVRARADELGLFVYAETYAS
jgi:UDP-2,3-diacylglucosamine hydrolase